MTPFLFVIVLTMIITGSTVGLLLQQTAYAASIEVPVYVIDEYGDTIVNGTQFIEYPDDQAKVEIPYKDDDKKAWINVEAYDICVQEDKQGTREAAQDLGQLPEQQDNETGAAYYEELLKSMDADGMDICIEFNGRYAETYGIAN